MDALHQCFVGPAASGCVHLVNKAKSCQATCPCDGILFGPGNKAPTDTPAAGALRGAAARQRPA